MTAEASARVPIAWIRERDVDLLLASELHGQPAFATWLFSAVGVADVAFEDAQVSVSQENGESDLVVRGRQPDSRRAMLLIENKVAASFQPEQDLRYAVRAERMRATGDYALVQTVLLAPSSYLETAEVAFDAELSYEALVQWLDVHGDARSAFFVRVVLAGIEAQRRGYVPVPDEAVSRFWSEYHRLVASEFAALRMPPPGSRPAGSSFIYFREALNRPIIGRRADIVHKFAHGWVDLQFAQTDPQDLECLRSRLPPNCEIARANKSASVRRTVPKLDPQRPVSDQLAEARAALSVALELHAWALGLGPTQP
jgi:hypothetical protein